MTDENKPWLKSYDDQVKPEIEVPDVTLLHRVDQMLFKFPSRPATHFMGTTLTYRQLMNHAHRVANALKEHGLEPGDVVGINLPNIPQYMIAHLGVLKAGCAVSGVSPLLTPKEMAYQLHDCKARALVTLDAIFEHRLLKVIDQLPHLKLVVCAGIVDFLPAIKRFLATLLKKVPTGKVAPVEGKTVIRFMDMLKRYPANPPSVSVSPDDTCLIQYTGGTTGTPKGTVLTHRNIIANLTQTIEWSKPEEGEEVLLSGFPLFHLAGLAMGMISFFVGGTQILIPDPRNTKHIVGEIARYKPTILVNVPSLYQMLVETKGFRDLDFSKLKYCVSGAAPFPADSINELESVIGKGKLVEVYGMTETSPLITMNPRFGEKKIGTVGLPLPSTRVRLMDIETGTREVGPGEEGEIAVRGPQVMKEYLDKPDETAHALRQLQGEKWLFTGDVARMDEDGYFTIVDRSKDMLNVGGYKVFSREVEDKLHDHPVIEMCAIIGVPNPKRPGSDLVKLVVQPAQEHKGRAKEDLEKELLEFAREILAPYKVPKIMEFVDELPLTAVGKVDKKALR